MTIHIYLSICVFIKIQPDNTGNMYTILKTQNVQNKIVSKGKGQYLVFLKFSLVIFW